MTSSFAKTPWILVAGDFRHTGGMDKANRALANFLLERGTPVHLIAHFVDSELAAHPLTSLHIVPKPLRSYFLGGPLLDLKARAVLQDLRRVWPATRIVANGGNCVAAGVNWAHFVHSAWKPDLSDATLRYRVRWSIEHRWETYRERLAYRQARLVITNSEMTSKDVRSCLGRAPEQADDQVHCVYLGSDSEWGPVEDSERAAQRQAFGIPANRKMALFVGALSSENRKGLDVAVRAWETLCHNPAWDVDLWIAGAGPSRARWESFVSANGLHDRIRFLGYRNDVPQLLACADLLVSSPRYEPYGLNIQEALARGIAVITSTRSGIAERFPNELRALLCENPWKSDDLVNKLLLWRSFPSHWTQLCARFGKELSVRSWASMAKEIVELIENGPGTRELDAPVTSGAAEQLSR